MATINYFYDSQTDSLDYGSVFHLYMVTWLSEQFLNSETTRVIYSDNAYAFRKRSDSKPVTNEGNLGLPFINFIQKGGDSRNAQNWDHWRLEKPGIYVPEIQARLRMMPITIPYEATYWCASAKEMRYIANKLYFFRDNHTDLQVDISYTYTDDTDTEVTVQIPHYVKLNFTGISVDPEYEQNAWLEKNVKHSISMDFEINTWGFLLDKQFTISETTILQFTSSFDKYTQEYWDKTLELT